MLLTYFGNKSKAVEGGTISAACLYHQHNQSIHVTDSVTVVSLSASLQHKTSMSSDRVCKFALN